MGVLVIGLTGCGKQKSNPFLEELGGNSSPEDINSIKGLYDNYFWLEKVSGISLYNINGKKIYTLQNGYSPITKVHGNFFIAVDSNHVNHLYNVNTLKEVTSINNVEYDEIDGIVILHKSNEKINSNNYDYGIKVWTKNASKEAYYYKIDGENLIDVTDQVNNGILEQTISSFSFDNPDWELYLSNRPDFMSLEYRYNQIYEKYVYNYKGTFTVISNGNLMFNEIKGSAIPDLGKTNNMVVINEDKIYISNEDGKKIKDITYIPDGYTISIYYNGYIVAKEGALSSICHLYSPEGNEIKIK